MKNPKFLIKPQKLGHKRWNAWKGRIRTLTKWRKTWSRLRNPRGRGLEWVRELLRGEESREIERDRAKWVWDRENPLYTSSVILNRSRSVERCRALKGSTDVAIKQVSKAKRILMDRGSVEELLRGQKIAWSIDLTIERCWDYNKKKLKSSIDKLCVERCREAIEIA